MYPPHCVMVIPGDLFGCVTGSADQSLDPSFKKDPPFFCDNNGRVIFGFFPLLCFPPSLHRPSTSGLYDSFFFLVFFVTKKGDIVPQ